MNDHECVSNELISKTRDFFFVLQLTFFNLSERSKVQVVFKMAFQVRIYCLQFEDLTTRIGESGLLSYGL